MCDSFFFCLRTASFTLFHCSRQERDRETMIFGYEYGIIFFFERLPQGKSEKTITNMPVYPAYGLLSGLRQSAYWRCFALRSSLIRPSSTFQSFFTFTHLPGSSVLLQTTERSEVHPSILSPVLSALLLGCSCLKPTFCLCPPSCLRQFFQPFLQNLFSKTCSSFTLSRDACG